MNDVIANEKSDKSWKAMILENEYIKLCVTPELGGKLYYGTDKTNGYNFIYKNGVIKPSNIGMLGAWVSGGIEWCVIHHHRASTLLPVDYDLEENADGSKTIWIGETEPRHRMRWTIGTPENSKTAGKGGDMRSPQINYYIGLANELLGKKEVATSAFVLSSAQTLRENNYIRYYQGLSFLKIGNKKKATEYFNALISEGEKQIKVGSEIDFFAKFGERESENVRLSNAYLLKGLGYKGLGNTNAATENLKKAVELSASNLYAKLELESTK